MSSVMRVAHLLEDVYPEKVYSVEDGTVWVSGMNAGCKRLANDMARTLTMHGISAGLAYDDRVHAVDNGGVAFNYGGD